MLYLQASDIGWQDIAKVTAFGVMTHKIKAHGLMTVLEQVHGWMMVQRQERGRMLRKMIRWV
jgi:hypothetical protein